jgi:hypothetical protein
MVRWELGGSGNRSSLATDNCRHATAIVRRHVPSTVGRRAATRSSDASGATRHLPAIRRLGRRAICWLRG